QRPDYVSSRLRSPSQPLGPPPRGPAAGEPPQWEAVVGRAVADLTAQGEGAPIGQRIVVSGRVLDEDARPVPGTMVEVWQANAAGRYAHPKDQWDAPLDPNFTGVGRAITDDQGRYRFVTVR